MIRAPAREVNYWTGSRWLSLAVAWAVIAVLAGLLFVALQDMEERAEAMMVEITLRNIRTGLMMAKGEAILAGREADIARWAGRNPVDWLAAPPAGYEGECRAAGSPAGGGWCFDAGRRELRYRPSRDRLQLADGREGGEVLRWRTSAEKAVGNAPAVVKVTESE